MRAKDTGQMAKGRLALLECLAAFLAGLLFPERIFGGAVLASD
jgi:hypothetical protein